MIFQLSSQSKESTVGKSDSALDFRVDIVFSINAGYKVDEIIYEFKVMTVNSVICMMAGVISSYQRPLLYPNASLPINSRESWTRDEW